MELTNDEIVDILDVNYIVGSTTVYTLAPSVFEITDIIVMLKPLLPNKKKVNTTIDDVRLKSKSTTIKTIKFTEIFFLYCFRFHSTTLRSFR